MAHRAEVGAVREKEPSVPRFFARTHEHAPYACAHAGPQKRREGTLRPRLSCRDFHTSSACVSVARRCLRYVDDIVSQGYDELVFLKDADESDLQDVITGVGTL